MRVTSTIRGQLPPRLGRVGSRLVAGTRPVRLPGCNIYDLGLSDTVTTTGAYLTDNDIRARLDAAVSMGAKLVRTHAFISAGHPLSIFPTQATLRAGTPQEASFLKLDRIVYEAGLRGLYLMFPLQDQHTPDYYHGNGVTFANMSLGTATTPATTATTAIYYSDTTVRADTKLYNAALYNRVNTLNRVAYKDDPTVAIIETVNEGYSASAAWTQDILDHGRSICTATLFADGSNACDGRYPDGTDSTGTLAGYNGLTLARPADVHGSHLYDSNRMSTAWLNKASRMTASAGYVHLLAEFGWTNNTQGLSTETFLTTTQRQDFLVTVEANSDVQGSLFWSLFAGSGSPPSGTHGDRFEMCFPPTNDEQANGADDMSTHAARMASRLGKPAGILLLTSPNDGRIIVPAPNGSGGLDTGPLANAIALAKSRGGRQMIQLQPGIYSANPGVLAMTTDNVVFAGSGMGITEIAKTGAGDLITINPPTNDASVIQRVAVRDIRLNGNNFTGALISHRFASQCHVINVEFGYNLGIGLDMIRPWDTVVDSCLFDHCGPTDGTDASLHVRNSAATSGALFSASGQANMVTFRALRVESYRRAIIIERGAGNTVDPYGMYFHGLKCETYYAHGGTISVVNVRGVSFRDVDLSTLGLDAGASADVGFNWSPLFRSRLDGIRFNTNTGACYRGIDSYLPSTGSHAFKNIAAEGAAFGDALIRHNNTSPADIKGLTAQNGVVSIGSVPGASP